MSYIVILMSFTAIFPSIGYGLTQQISSAYLSWRRSLQTVFLLLRDGKWGLTMWNYITAYILENVTSFTEYKDTSTQQLYNPFFYTVLISSQTRTLFFVLDFLDILPNKKMHNHPRKTRSAIDSQLWMASSGEKPWRLRVRMRKNPGGNTKTQKSKKSCKKNGNGLLTHNLQCVYNIRLKKRIYSLLIYIIH